MKRRTAQVQDFMTPNPVVISPQTSLIDAYTVMCDNEIRRLPVVEQGELVGIITMSDILRSVPNLSEDETDTATRLLLVTLSVVDLMTSEPVTISPDDTIQDAAELMLENQVSGIPVMQGDQVVGIITESDIFKLVVDSWSGERIEQEY
jgi:acetoin utilization protein AcuB